MRKFSMKSLSSNSQWLVAALVLSVAGCQQFGSRPMAWNWPSMPNMPSWKSLSLRSQSPDKDDMDEDEFDDEFETTLDIPMVGDYTTVTGLNLISLQGVGLVTGLPGTGSDPPPSSFRTRLMEDMRRRGIRSPNAILRSPSTALVVIQAYLPPLIRKGEKFDIEVRVPGADETTSLNGGWLMETHLSEQAVVPGQGPMKGHVYAKARGPLLISATEGGKESRAALLRRGKVLGGGMSLKDRDLALFLRNDFRSVRNSRRIADRIGKRYSDYDKSGIKRPLAEALTDQRIELIVPLRYRDNYPRYLQVIRNIAFRETEVAQRVRTQRLKKDLNSSATAELASMQLEAIGSRAVPILRAGLNNPSLEVRFHSAIALTYLNERDGMRTLVNAARDEPAFRVFAFAALAASEEPEVSLLLRELLHEASAETRYGAWRALTIADRRDPLVRGEDISDEFKFHVLNTTGPPMIHLTNRKKAEIVLFGSDQRFQTPLALRAGNDILITAAEGADQVTVARYEVGKPDRRKRVSARVADVIRAVAELDATYPDIAQMLAQADKQHNVPGTIELDAVPQSGRVYYRPSESLGERRRTRIGNPNQAPNIFSTRGNKGKKSFRSGKFGGLDLDSGVSSTVDIREEDDEENDMTDGSFDVGDEGKLDSSDNSFDVSDPGKWYDLRRYWKSPFPAAKKDDATADDDFDFDQNEDKKDEPRKTDRRASDDEFADEANETQR
jgi:hypothetical protein